MVMVCFRLLFQVETRAKSHQRDTRYGPSQHRPAGHNTRESNRQRKSGKSQGYETKQRVAGFGIGGEHNEIGFSPLQCKGDAMSVN